MRTSLVVLERLQALVVAVNWLQGGDWVTIPGLWWRHAALVAANWKSQLRWHVDQFIADALGR